MTLVLFAVVLLLGSGLAALAPWRSPLVPARVAAAGAVAGGALAVTAAVAALLGHTGAPVKLYWAVPLGSFEAALDGLSALFLLLIGLIGALAAVYGVGYLYAEQRHNGFHWLCFNLLLAGMMLVVTARHAVLFLVAWEVMSLAAFFLVTHDDERTEVREAGWTYLVATHLGTTCLLAAFVLLGAGGRLAMDVPPGLSPARATAIFLLAVFGFGAKAGLWPLHVWLPHAHPAAPSHVSAVMSAVMLKTGIYGLLRVLTLLPPPPAWWGWLLLALGAASGVLGALLALASRDLKRVLAYSSVENIGLIAIGLGCGLLGVAHGHPAMAVLGFAGALLHVLNHGLLKGLLFLGAGAVLHGAGTGNLESLGGLGRRMPMTSRLFALGATGISGFPPLPGFVSELVLLLAALSGVASGSTAVAVPAALALAAIALTSGGAAVCFARAYGIAFLGEPRSEAPSHAHDPGAAMRVPMLVLAALAVVTGLGGFLIVPRLVPLVALLARAGTPDVTILLTGTVARTLAVSSAAGVAVALLVAALLVERARRLALAGVGASPTWDCGFAAPTARMQYTASSFAEPLVTLFASVLRTRRSGAPVDGLFPASTTLATETPDVAESVAWRPAFATAARACERLHVLQQGRVQVYVLYVAITLVVLLVWGLW